MDDSIWANVASFLGEAPAPKSPNVPFPPAEAKPEHLHATITPSLFVVCFSKDRPFQLNELLRSFLLADLQATREGFVCINVIWKAEQALFKKNYVNLAEKYRFVRFIAEVEGDFGPQLDTLLEEFSTRAKNGFVLFAVDDAVFYRPVGLKTIITFMRQRNDLLCFQLKLSNCIQRCQPQGFKEMAQPVFIDDSVEDHPPSFRTFEAGSGTLDWNYPWDMTCSIYPLKVASMVMEQLNMLGMEVGSPNALEAQGQLCMKLLLKDNAFPRRCALLGGLQCMSVVTVNRVQEMYRTPVYDSEELYTAEALNDAYGAKEIELPKYAEQEAYDTVHIGSLFLVQKCVLSVIIPVRNAEQVLPTALRSLANQECDYPFEIVVIDDGSQDGTLHVAQAFMTEHNVPTRLVSSRGKGVGAALNTGLFHCRADLVARMDADDISSPIRFRRQLEYLHACPHVFALGGSAYIFGDGEVSGIYESNGWVGAIQGLRRVNVVTSSWQVEWETYFRCALIHPTVVMNRTTLMSLGGYCENSKAEDYDLWLRALRKGQTLENLPGEPILLLRKYSGNVSKEADPRKLSIDTALDGWKSIVGMNEQRGVTPSLVQLLQFNEIDAEERVSIEDAIELVNSLERHMLQKNCEEKGIQEWLVAAANSRIAGLAAVGYARAGSSKCIAQALAKRGMSVTDIVSSVIKPSRSVRGMVVSTNEDVDLDELD